MTSDTIRLLAANAVILACLAAGSVGAEQSVTRPPPRSPSIDDVSLTKPWTGDLDGMIKRRQIRVLLPYSKTHYFIDKGVQRGVTYDALKQFENELNTRLKTGTLRVHVVFLPTPLDKLQAALLESCASRQSELDSIRTCGSTTWNASPPNASAAKRSST
jgi:hypothetical protein